MRTLRSPFFAVVAAALFSGCPSPVSDDDDSTDDDGSGGAELCGDPSRGTGGESGTVWLETPNFSAGGDSSRYASLLIVPAGVPPKTGLPLLVLMSRRMPDARSEVEDIVGSFLDFEAFAGDTGYLVAMIVPGPAGTQGYSWTNAQQDEDFFDATLDLLGEQYDIDRDRVFLWGSSAGATAAALLGHTHAERVASIAAHAGRSPWGPDAPEPWPGEVPGLFIHGPDDTIVTRAAVDEIVGAWEGGGQRTETWFDYPHGHEWVPASANGPMLEFFDSTCNE
jgi:poly(3-hydroxybutyrate) depolymerase